MLEFEAQCSNASSSADSTSTYVKLGKIMQASRDSLLHDYENGCDELVRVCEIAEQGGALGSRPTGAGWGGSTVSLVEQDKVHGVVKALQENYYDVKFPHLTNEDFHNAVLVSQPAGGACVYKV